MSLSSSWPEVEIEKWQRGGSVGRTRASKKGEAACPITHSPPPLLLASARWGLYARLNSTPTLPYCLVTGYKMATDYRRKKTSTGPLWLCFVILGSDRVTPQFHESGK